MFTHAITRLPGENFADGLTTANLGRPDFERILQQHRAYRQALLSAGLDVIVLPAEPAYPDAYFVEDPAIITPKLAVLTRSGAPSRSSEGASLRPIIEYYLPVVQIISPGTVDGGDVLMIGEHFFIGLSERTNHDGATQLSAHLANAGYTSEIVPLTAGLHLKSCVNYLGKNTIITNKSLASYPGFSEYTKIILDDGEDYAANTLWVNDVLLIPIGFPKVCSKLSILGMSIIELNVSEVQKMDGGLTCMSLRF